MPEKRHSRTRETLPEGYQFGDAKKHPIIVGRSGAMFVFEDETSAAQFCDVTAQRLRARDWNVIEAETHSDEWAV